MHTHTSPPQPLPPQNSRCRGPLQGPRAWLTMSLADPAPGRAEDGWHESWLGHPKLEAGAAEHLWPPHKRNVLWQLWAWVEGGK